MVDFHSHFLPDMDDGSRSIEESLQMLKLSYDMGIYTIVATPHYFSNFESIDDFINRRNEKLEYFTNKLEGVSEIPRIVAGAEVTFYSGMGSDDKLSCLCIGNTKCLLVEMPYYRWSSLTKKEILSVMLNQGIVPVIAHIERYFICPQNEDIIRDLLDLGAVAQINGESIICNTQRKKMLKLIKERKTVLLGSDCHNMSDRKPNLDKAFKIIEKKTGRLSLRGIEEFSREMLENKP